MQAGRPPDYQMHNSEICQLESTQRGYYGPPTVCLNLEYANISSPLDAQKKKKTALEFSR